MKSVKQFFLSLIFILIADFFWLGLIAKDFYQDKLLAFQIEFNLVAAVFAYLLLGFGVWFFALKGKNNFKKGFLLGLFGYGIYNLSNWATLKGWTLEMVAVDMLWGGFLLGMTAFLIKKIEERQIGKKIRL
jgi:uncharacterized membrane protein